MTSEVFQELTTHPPPHFHAKFAEFEELIEIETLETYAGKIPGVQRKKVTEWTPCLIFYLISATQ